jgi:cation transporter-like permease
VLAAQAAARRRTVIAVALAVLGLLAGVAVQEREAQMQQMEAWK